MKMKKVTAMGMAVLMAATMIPAVPAMADDAGKVYYLNFKPEQDEDWQNLAKEYTEETGTEVTVVTAASGQYETTLQSEMAKSDAPTLFQVNGPVGLKNWKDYCYDLKDSDIYSQLTSDSYSLKDGDAVDGIAYVIESYGLIVNKTLLEKAGYTLDDIKSFDDLKKVADDIQSKKDDLGIKGAFTSAGMDGSSDWRFKTHLANLPIYYEYKEDGIDDTDAIKGTYLDNYKNVFDLYITDSTCDGSELSAKTADDSRNEFVNGEAVFYQNGSWEYSELSKTFKDDELAMIPIYFGVDDENEGLCVGTENYWAVNAKASQEDIDATLEFLNWVITSDEGRDAITNQMGLTAPYDTFTGDYETKNAFAQAANKLMTDGKTSVAWSFNATPNVDDWRADVVSALTAYTAGEGEWDAVKTAFVDGWANQWKIAHEDDAQ